jgi:hypothetical protein
MGFLPIAVKKLLLRRVALAAGLWVALLYDKPHRRRLAWAVRLYVISVLLFAGVCVLLHLMMIVTLRP